MLMFMYIYACIHVSMSLFDRVIRNRPCGGMIAYAGEWQEEVPGYEESSGKNSHDKYMRSVSCEYEFILHACIMPMLILWIGYTEGYNNIMKIVWSATC